MAFKKTVILILGFVFLLAGCSRGSYVTVKSVENNTASSMSMRYEKFSGTKARTVNLDDGELSIEVAVVTESGSLDLTITDTNGKNYYTGTDMETSAFIVRLDSPGKYVITLNADNHKGSYSVSW